MKKILICTALSAMLLAGCSFKGNDCIIKVNDTKVTRAQFDAIMDKEIDNSMFKNFGGAKNFVKSDDNVMYVIYKEKVSKELVIKALIEQEIAKRNIKVSEDDIKAEMKLIIDKVGSKEELNNLLKQRGISNEEFKKDLITQIKIKKLVASIKQIKISDSEAEQYYNQHKSEFTHGEQVRASHILISANTLEMIQAIKKQNKDITPEELNKKVEEMTASQKLKAEAILAEVKANPNDFERIARDKSEDRASAVRGGELGYFPREQMVPEFSKAAFSMKPDTICEELIRTPYGYHIIKVTDRIEAGASPYAKVKDDIKFYLETQEQVKVLKNLTDGLMKNAKIEYVDSSFSPDSISKILSQPSKDSGEKDNK